MRGVSCREKERKKKNRRLTTLFCMRRYVKDVSSVISNDITFLGFFNFLLFDYLCVVFCSSIYPGSFKVDECKLSNF